MTTTTLRRRLLRTAVLIPALALTLSGCAFGFSPDGRSGLDDDPAPVSSAPEDEAPTDATPDTDAPDTDDGFTREAIAARATQQVTCGGGDLELADIGVVVEVTDDCARLVVSGHGGVVLGASVADLEVSGVGAVVLVADVDTVHVTGDGSVVLWESGAPAVEDESVGSTLLPAGAAR